MTFRTQNKKYHTRTHTSSSCPPCPPLHLMIRITRHHEAFSSLSPLPSCLDHRVSLHPSSNGHLSATPIHSRSLTLTDTACIPPQTKLSSYLRVSYHLAQTLNAFVPCVCNGRAPIRAHRQSVPTRLYNSSHLSSFRKNPKNKTYTQRIHLGHVLNTQF